MQRVTITLDDDLMADLDRIIAARGYQNRSEAIRDLTRSGLEQAAVEVAGSRHCVATLVYVYDHHARELPKRLTQEFHAHHDLSQATLHVHLDAQNCLEVTVLKGRGTEVQAFANQVQGLGLNVLNRFAQSDWPDRLRMRKSIEKLLYAGTRTGFQLAGAMARQFGKGGAKLDGKQRLPAAAKGLFDLSLTEEQQMMRDTLQRFARDALRPAAHQADHEARNKQLEEAT